MIIIKQKEDYIYVSSSHDNLDDFITIFKEEHPLIKNKNIIITISEEFKAKIKDIFVFLEMSKYHKDNGTTFVAICKGIDVDSFPEEFNIVPTLQEAEDILEMENIERDLGF